MNDIKVSVIIPVYNVEQYLEKCLDSIINQTLKEIEIICINDGSKDKSLNILQEYQRKDSRIKVIDKANEGVSIARNTGINAAVGDYISFIDADDWIQEDFLKELYDTAKAYNSDIACGNIIRVCNNKKRNKLIYTKKDYSNDPDIKNSLTKIPIYNFVWNKIYKRETLAASGVKFPEGRVYEDIIWSIQTVYYLNGVVTVPEAIYYYRKNKKSIMSTKSKKSETDCELSEQEMFEFAKEKNLKVLEGYKYAKRDRYKFCGITLMKRFYYYPDVTEYCLLGFIPIYRCKTKAKK